MDWDWGVPRYVKSKGGFIKEKEVTGIMKALRGRIILVLCAILLLGASSISTAQKRYNEAPMLAELVEQGKLPPIDKRLPEEPLVVTPVEEVGKYGGTWKRAILGPANDYSWLVTATDSLVRWQYTDGKLKVVPNVAKKWDISEDGRVYTFYLRKGMKWSDGEPFTADDILFWYNDVLLNEELTPVFPQWLKAGGKPGKVEKVDDYTVRFVFEKPHGLFLQLLAYNEQTFAPKHYLKQFHAKYTPKDKLDRLVKEAKLDSWQKLYAAKKLRFSNPELPVITAWKVTVPLPATRMVAERNPYYWKVDPKGNQLPYIDRVTFDDVANLEVLTMRALNGDFDMLDIEQTTFENYALYMENRDRGNYRVLRWSGGSGACIYVNQNVKDPVLRTLFGDRRFRMALSLAINREELNSLFFNGVGVICQPAGGPGDPFFKEGFGKTAIECDIQKANRLLDELGLTKRDAQGYRLRPDGKTLSVTIETYEYGVVKSVADLYQTVANYWKDIGIKATVKVHERSLWTKRATAGEMDLPGYSCCLLNWALDSGLWYVPTDSRTYWAPLAGTWYATGGQGGEEPTGDLRRLQILWEQLNGAADPGKQLEIGQEILSIHDKNLYIIGLCWAPFRPVIVKNNLRNVLEEAPASWRCRGDLITWPEQLFFK